ncbi:DUF6680 family protein [Sphingosinicella sp.]|uniref:DUF6680 family protein n=1 Tax=Sphingosinicella sp. TaxID=1917971 RepID=UPI002628A19E|nr:DUF6680 family protein [Sphingosinicella sp.]
MIWDYTIRWIDVAIILATILGPILAVQAQKWLERRRVIQERRLAIFRTLMATRAAMLSTEHVQALNAIPVEFYGNKRKLKDITDSWKLFLDHHSQDVPTTEVWMQKRIDLFMDLLFQISQFLGYDFNRAQLSRDIYSPRAHGDLETEQAIIRRGFVQLFSGEIALPMAVKEFPATADDETLAHQATLQTLLLEVLAGTRVIKVEAQSPKGAGSQLG